MRKSTLILSLTLLSPALLAGCGDKCDDRYEDCRSRGGGYSGGVYRSGGSGVGVSGGGNSVSGTSRGGFGGFGGAHGFGG